METIANILLALIVYCMLFYTLRKYYKAFINDYATYTYRCHILACDPNKEGLKGYLTQAFTKKWIFWTVGLGFFLPLILLNILVKSIAKIEI